MSGNRKDRSRSPTWVGNIGRRRDAKNVDVNDSMNNSNNIMNPMMMANMYPQGMMMSGMYQNMMMQNMIGGVGGMMPSTGMEMMAGSGMDLISQPAMDISMSGNNQLSGSNTPNEIANIGMMGGMVMDPSMIGMYNMGGDMVPTVEKKEMVFKSCKLTPPVSGASNPPRRSKPPGCRTIFLGGLPDKIREGVVREVFEHFGRIHTLRLSVKNFCHIRFEREASVDAAMTCHGYHIKLTGEDDDMDDDSKATTGTLYVDYALSRDDQNEYERQQRLALRMQEEQMQQLTAQQQAMNNMGQDPGNYRSKRSPSPPTVQLFSNSAISQLAEKIKNEETFPLSLPTLIVWLERGECSKKNSTQFYSMIQATNSHIRKLFNEKMQAEEEFTECRERVKQNIQKIITQLEQVAKVFVAATHQRVWDHFTKPQRKNIETWQKMAQEFQSLKEEFAEKFCNDDIEYNNGYNTHNRNFDSVSNDYVQNLKRENDSLQFQLEAYKNEVDVIKADAAKEMEKFKAQFIARQALQSTFEKNQSSHPLLPAPVVPAPVSKPPPPPLPEELDAQVHLKETVEAGCGEAKLIGVMSAFLQVHPQGASLDYVVSYVRALFSHVSQATIHHVLQKHPDVFQLSTSGVGANIENRWSFVAFKKESLENNK